MAKKKRQRISYGTAHLHDMSRIGILKLKQSYLLQALLAVTGWA